MKPGPSPVSPEKRFWSHVDKSPKRHWLWRGRINKDGYGVFGVSGFRWVLAHRYAWTLKHGRIRGGKKILHTCVYRHCVLHTYKGTNKDNTRDMMERGRGRWDGAGRRKLNADKKKSLLMKIVSGRSCHSLAKEYGVSVSTIIFYKKRANKKGLV